MRCAEVVVASIGRNGRPRGATFQQLTEANFGFIFKPHFAGVMVLGVN